MSRLAVRLVFAAVVSPLVLSSGAAQTLPLAQSKLDARAADPRYRIPLDSTSDARWLGGGASVPRWSIDGEWFYVQFATDPKPIEGAAAPDDPWWRIAKDGSRVESVTRADAARIPLNAQYTKDLSRAVWFSRNELTYWKRGAAPRVLIGRQGFLAPRWSPDERTIRWNETNAVYEMDPETGTQRQLTAPVIQTPKPAADKVKEALKKDQLALFDFVKRQKAIRDSSARLAMADPAWKPTTTPYKLNDALSFIDITPQYVTYLVTPRVTDEQTHFGDYVNEEGIVVDRTSRPKVGVTPAAAKVAIVPNNAALHADSVKVVFVDDTPGRATKKLNALSCCFSYQTS